MALFGFGKKKYAEKEFPACACNGGCECSEATEIENACCTEAASGKICCVKVLGPGRKSCHALLEGTKAALAEMGIAVEVEYITDMQRIMEYGVMSVPALIVNENVVSMGKALKTAEVVKLLRKFGFLYLG